MEQDLFCVKCKEKIIANHIYCHLCGADQRPPSLRPASPPPATASNHVTDAAPINATPESFERKTPADLLSILVMWGALLLDIFCRSMASVIIRVSGVSANYLIVAFFALVFWVTSLTLAIRLIKNHTTADKVNGGIVLGLNVIMVLIVIISFITFATIPKPNDMPNQNSYGYP